MTYSSLQDLSVRDSHDQGIDVTTLFTLVEKFLARPLEAMNRLCQAVETLSYQQARLHCFPRTYWSRSALSGGAHQFPVVYDHRIYGTLVTNFAGSDAARPALSNEQAQQIASTCGVLLYLLEQAALVQALCRHLSPTYVEPLTARQREVLGLMVQGLTDEEIAQTLYIAPETLKKHRHEIYQRLGVHHARDVLLMAYQAQVLSFLIPPTQLISLSFPFHTRP